MLKKKKKSQNHKKSCSVMFIKTVPTALHFSFSLKNSVKLHNVYTVIFTQSELVSTTINLQWSLQKL